MKLPSSGISIVLVLASACYQGDAPRPAAEQTAEVPTPHTDPSFPSPSPSPVVPGFVDRVWRVESSTAVAEGTLYTFESDGTLLIDAPGGTPTTGSWFQSDSGLVMVEESVPYRVDVLHLSDSRFVIRSHNPGEPVDITLVPADAP